LMPFPTKSQINEEQDLKPSCTWEISGKSTPLYMRKYLDLKPPLLQLYICLRQGPTHVKPKLLFLRLFLELLPFSPYRLTLPPESYTLTPVSSTVSPQNNCNVFLVSLYLFVCLYLEINHTKPSYISIAIYSFHLNHRTASSN